MVLLTRRFTIALLWGGLSLVSSAFSQDDPQRHPNSPVFKNYRPPPVMPRIEQSDALYQIWQAFLAARKANAGDILAQHEMGIRYLLGKGVEPDTVKAAYWIRIAASRDLMSARFNLGILAYNGWGMSWNPFEAFQQFHYCAQHDMEEAQYVMGQFYTENLVVPRDWNAAYAWVKKAADAGFKPAEEALPQFAKHLMNGKGADQRADTSKLSAPATGIDLVLLDVTSDSSAPSGKKMLRDVLRSLTPELRVALGLTSMLDGEMAVDSLKLISMMEAGNAGSPEALTVLGRCYENGVAVRKDPVTACAYYVRAVRLDAVRGAGLLWDLLKDPKVFQALKTRAMAGDATARFAWAGVAGLGYEALLAQNGVFLPPAEALRMLQGAAEQGYVPAQIELGLCYYAGRWVAVDQARATTWWRKAEGVGSREAAVRLAMLAVTSGVSTAVGASVDTLWKSSVLGSVLAEVGLGYCYEHGIGVRKSRGDAAHYYRAGAMRGSQDADRALRRMYDEIRPNDKAYAVENN